jgi:pimeloyl-ACP methyl ester carboxylesterase
MYYVAMTKRATTLIAISMTLLMSLFVATPAQARYSPGEDLSIKVHSSHRGWCLTSTVPVAPAPDQPRSWKVLATYCQPFKWAHGSHEVDVLTHGATYTGAYWDWTQNPSLYSYVGKTLADGRATLDYDRIGDGGAAVGYNPGPNGASTRPLSTEITMATDAYVLHQLVQGLKLLGFRHINSISHSYGAGVVLVEASTYTDVNAVVLTGYLHRPSNPAVTAGNYPANQDPRFAGLGLDNGYLTSRPGVRGTSFHSPSSDPAVVAFDDAHKDLVSLTGLLGFLGQRAVPAAINISNLIKVPVLVVNGQQDAIFCYDPSLFNCVDAAAVMANEAPYYTAAASFQVVTIPESGHDLTLHPSANESYTVISDWLKTN